MLFKLITLLSALVSVLCYAFWLGGSGPWAVLWLFLVFGASFLGLTLLSVLILWLLVQPIDLSKPQENDSPFYRRLAGVYAEALIQAFQAKVTTRGLEQTPGAGRFLLVCNHNAMADPGILLHHFRRSQLAFISKKENERLFVIGRIMHPLLCQSIDREDDRSALKTILRCIQILKEDKASIAVFPEGGTHHDDQLHPFRPGVFKIAQKTGVPVVVCALTGTREIIPNGLRLRSTPVELRLVRVIQPEEYAGMKTTELSDWVHRLMAEDLARSKEDPHA